MAKNLIDFKEIKVVPKDVTQIFKIYYVIDNGRSKFLQGFNSLKPDQKDIVKTLFFNMATRYDFNSLLIKKSLRGGYSFGEIRPKPDRFFFFRKCGKNLIFFDHLVKKKNSLHDDIYKRIQKKKDRYEKEFERFLKGA